MMTPREDDPNIWRTRSGDQIPIEDLDDDHLLNIVRTIGRADVRELRRLLGFAADMRAATDTFWSTRVLAPGIANGQETCPTAHAPPDVVRAREVLAGTDRQVLLHLVPQLPALEGEVLRRGLQS